MSPGLRSFLNRRRFLLCRRLLRRRLCRRRRACVEWEEGTKKRSRSPARSHVIHDETGQPNDAPWGAQPRRRLADRGTVGRANARTQARVDWQSNGAGGARRVLRLARAKSKNTPRATRE